MLHNLRELTSRPSFQASRQMTLTLGVNAELARLKLSFRYLYEAHV
jgi:hypothetical protein